MATTTISLPDDQLARLRQHALTSERSLDEVVQEAVNAYLAQLPKIAKKGVHQVPDPPAGPANPGWEPVTKVTPDGIRLRIPPDMAPEEAEMLAAQPSPEARREYLASWLIGRGARVIEPANEIPDDEWKARFDAVLARIQQAGPTDLTPDEIEREITHAREEVRHALSSD